MFVPSVCSSLKCVELLRSVLPEISSDSKCGPVKLMKSIGREQAVIVTASHTFVISTHVHWRWLRQYLYIPKQTKISASRKNDTNTIQADTAFRCDTSSNWAPEEIQTRKEDTQRNSVFQSYCLVHRLPHGLPKLYCEWWHDFTSRQRAESLAKPGIDL